VLFKNSFKISADLLFRHVAESGSIPGVADTLHDKRAVSFSEFVGVCSEDAVLVLTEGECQPMEGPLCAQPDVLVLARVQHRHELVAEMAPHHAVGAVRTDQQITAWQFIEARNVGPEVNGDAQVRAPLLENIEQTHARDAREFVAVNADLRVAMNDI